MKILAMEKEVPGVSVDQFTPEILKEEAARAWELNQAGVFREMYFRQDWPGAVLVLECQDVAEAGEYLNTLPLVQAGLITIDVIPLVAYPGFSRLFSDSK